MKAFALRLDVGDKQAFACIGREAFFIKWVWQRYLGVKSDFFPNNFMIILLIGSARRDRDDDGRAHTRNDTAR